MKHILKVNVFLKSRKCLIRKRLKKKEREKTHNIITLKHNIKKHNISYIKALVSTK